MVSIEVTPKLLTVLVPIDLIREIKNSATSKTEIFERVGQAAYQPTLEAVEGILQNDNV